MKLTGLVACALLIGASSHVPQSQTLSEPNSKTELTILSSTRSRAVIDSIDEKNYAPASLAVASASELKHYGPSHKYQAQRSAPSITVYYSQGHEAPAHVRSVIQEATNRWSQKLQLHPNGPIEVRVSWQSLGNPSVLGYAQPTRLYQSELFPTNNLYPTALANTILGRDVFNGPEILLTLNADLMYNHIWYVSTDARPGKNQIDLLGVVLHELGHGLGFTSNGLDHEHSAYDGTLLVDGQYPAVAHGNPHSLRTSDRLYVETASGRNHKIHAPHRFENGSSLSHFDEHHYPAGSVGALMTPAFEYGISVHEIDSAVLGVMSQIGWPLRTGIIAPSITKQSSTQNSLSVDWEIDHREARLYPDYLRAELYLRGSKIASKTLTNTATSVSFNRLTANRSYTVNIVGVRKGVKAESSTNIMTSGSSFTKTKVTRSRSLPLDDQLLRLYLSAFERNPDSNGFAYWLELLSQGASPESVAESFTKSPEFRKRYGNPSNREFVKLVYRHVLDREPDVAGLQFWTSKLDSGNSRGWVVTGFSESQEFIAKTHTVKPNGHTEGQLLRLYSASFLRNPDSSGRAYWSNQIANGTSLNDVAWVFASSSEFASRYGTLNHSEFIGRIYKNVLGRTPDAEGFNYWTTALHRGLSRGEVLANFSESPEHVLRKGYIR